MSLWVFIHRVQVVYSSPRFSLFLACDVWFGADVGLSILRCSLPHVFLSCLCYSGSSVQRSLRLNFLLVECQLLQRHHMLCDILNQWSRSNQHSVIHTLGNWLWMDICTREGQKMLSASWIYPLTSWLWALPLDPAGDSVPRSLL